MANQNQNNPQSNPREGQKGQPGQSQHSQGQHGQGGQQGGGSGPGQQKSDEKRGQMDRNQEQRK